jgi:hypothetical protein
MARKKQPATVQQTKAPPKLLHCSFCGLDQNEVKQLVAGLNDVCICDVCIEFGRDLVGAARLGLMPDKTH